RDLHPFPTRRSSDLIRMACGDWHGPVDFTSPRTPCDICDFIQILGSGYTATSGRTPVPGASPTRKCTWSRPTRRWSNVAYSWPRSEEHTSELQSREN